MCFQYIFFVSEINNFNTANNIENIRLKSINKPKERVFAYLKCRIIILCEQIFLEKQLIKKSKNFVNNKLLTNYSLIPCFQYFFI